MSTQHERSTTTRAKILTVARQIFAADGFEASSLETIAAQAGVTKGALYHHYKGKEALFSAVFATVSTQTLEVVGKLISSEKSSRAHLKAVAVAWLKAVESSDAQTILLDVGPKALGFARARAIEEDITLQPMLRLVEATIQADSLVCVVDASLATRLINAALYEIALLRYTSSGTSPSITTAADAIGAVIDGLMRDR